MELVGVSVLLSRSLYLVTWWCYCTCYFSSVLPVRSACGPAKGEPREGGGRADSGGLGNEGGFARDEKGQSSGIDLLLSLLPWLSFDTFDTMYMHLDTNGVRFHVPWRMTRKPHFVLCDGVPWRMSRQAD